MSEQRTQDTEERQRAENYDRARPEPDEAPDPQPERAEPTVDDPGPTDLSARDYVAILKRSVKESLDDHITSIAAALAYYSFMAIPSVALIALGIFGLFADPSSVTSLVDRLGSVVPGEAQKLLGDSLTRMTESQGAGIGAVAVGLALALWSVTGAMQNLMWATNEAYDREETRGFLRRRVAALAMVVFALLGFVLAFGVLVLGPHLSQWLGDALGAERPVELAWLIGQWPLLLVGLLATFAGLMYFAPNVEHPRWSFLSLGSLVAIVVWLAASAGFAFYASRFGSYNKAWGSLSAVVVMLTWLWLSNVALLFGAEVNAEAERSRELRQGEPAEVELRAPPKE